MQPGHIYKVPPPWTGPVARPQEQQQKQGNVYSQQFGGGQMGGIQPGTATGVPSNSSYNAGFPPQQQQYPSQQFQQQQYPQQYGQQPQSQYQQPPPPPPPPPPASAPAQQQWPQQQWNQPTSPPAPARPQSVHYNPQAPTYQGNTGTGYAPTPQYAGVQQTPGTPIQQQQQQAPPPPPPLPPPPPATQSYSQQTPGSPATPTSPYQQGQQPYGGQYQGQQWQTASPQQQFAQPGQPAAPQTQQAYYTGGGIGGMTPGSAAGYGSQQSGGTGTVQSPSENHVAYIPPSLSGAGVTAYQPVNTNPAPGVYVPPPPENVPAWGTVQPDGPKKFKYTPPVLHPEFGGVPGGGQYPPGPQQQQYQQAPQQQYPPNFQQSQQQPPPPPPPPPPVTSQQESWQQQQQPDQYQQPAQKYEQQSQLQPQQQHEQPQQQYGLQPQGPDPQVQAPPHTDPHRPVAPLRVLESQYTQRFDHLEQSQSTPTPPPPQAPAPSAYHNHFSQQQQQQQRISSPTPPPAPQQKNTIPPITGASVFSGPSDISGWEHYGSAADDEVSLASRPETPEIAEIGGTPTHVSGGYYSDQGGNPGFVSPPPPPHKVAAGLQKTQRPGSVIGGHAPPGRVMTPQQHPQRIMTPQEYQMHQPLQRIMTPQHQILQPPQRNATPQHQQQHAPQPPPNIHQQPDTHQWQQQPERIMTPQQQPPPPQSSSQGTCVEQVPGGWPQDPPQQPPQQPAQQTTQKPAQQSQYQHQQQQQPSQPPPQPSYEPVQTQQLVAPTQPKEEPNPLDSLEQFYADSIQRFIDMIQAEVVATSDEDKLRIFTEFMEKEYFIRGERYPNALGDIPSRQGSVFGGMKNPDGPVGVPSVEKTPEISNKEAASDVFVPPLFGGQHHTPQNQPHPPNIPSPIYEVAYQAPQQEEPKPPERVEAYQPFRPGAAPPNPQQPVEDPPVGNDGYKAFNPAVHGPPLHQGYVPFRPNESASPPAKSVTPGNGTYAPYKAPATRPGSRPASSGSDFVAYDTKRASIIDNRGPQPQPKRSSVIYNQPSRPQTMAPPVGGRPTEFGPPRHAPTAVDTGPYQAYVTPSANYRSPTRARPPDFTPEPEEKYPGGSEESFTPSQDVDLDELKLGPTPAPPILGLSTPVTVNPLSTILPATRFHKTSSTSVLDDIKKTIDEVGEDFSFIEKINIAYADASKERLEKLEEERRARQEEHQEYTDRLFADNEIGYGDIGDMDEAFNAEEAKRRCNEEETEWEKYRDEVFQKVYDKTQEGIKGLMDKHFQTINSLRDAVSGKERWTKIEGLELTDLLEGLILLRGYIERRHEKVQVAILERDRRYRRIVIQPLQVSGNFSKMKSMEKHFDESEKKTILEAAKQKFSRTFQLMETIEESIERGLTAELNYTEELTQAVTPLLTNPLRTASFKVDLLHTLELLSTLKEKSIKFMKAFHSASLLMNESTAEVGIAEGRKKSEVAKERLSSDEEAEKELRERVGVVNGDWAVMEGGVRGVLEMLKDVSEEGAVVPGGGRVNLSGRHRGANSGNPPNHSAGGEEMSALERAKMRNRGGGSGSGIMYDGY